MGAGATNGRVLGPEAVSIPKYAFGAIIFFAASIKFRTQSAPTVQFRTSKPSG